MSQSAYFASGEAEKHSRRRGEGKRWRGDPRRPPGEGAADGDNFLDAFQELTNFEERPSSTNERVRRR